jgi:hypothetical protein
MAVLIDIDVGIVSFHFGILIISSFQINAKQQIHIFVHILNVSAFNHNQLTVVSGYMLALQL